VRWLNPSAVLNFRKPPMDFEISTPANKKTRVLLTSLKGNGLWFAHNNGEWIIIPLVGTPSPLWGFEPLSI
jgi:hypothetical protein